ncbi:DNA (cytosine-5-)-methyltransferase [Staphylococcus xylosus]|uniref:DNA (cytosine-5-)-methyltransferase n=1 Tax=Staphylococcus xylosus TaxID=1288 RepID=UPI002DB9AF43|nr:DNA (cytosine-5-)-methyltransferase [Staphylococcus xylosus]MEB8060647.1 DNA (cytosine-5-)-methyltransferase [Staphylococcus xylosus]
MKFIDLFSGIGGFRIGMENAGFECVYSAEIDPHAAEMYFMNYGDNPLKDITKIDAHLLPDFDVLCAGFPCQSFSVSGKRLGFYDETRGTLFFDIYRILEAKKPKAFILENVKNLSTHDKGRTMNVIISSLENLGYTVNYSILNSRDFAVPQNRERTIIVGTLKNTYFDFNDLNKTTINSMNDFLDEDIDENEVLDKNEYTLIPKEYVKRQKESGLIFVGYRNKKIRTKGVREGTEHLSRVHKQPNRIYSSEGNHPTLSSQEPSGRYFVLDQIHNNVRKLSLDECYRFMGFPENFIKYGKKSELYRRIGNSVNPIMIEQVGKNLMKILKRDGEKVTDTVREDLEKIYNYCKETDLEKLTSDYHLDEKQLDAVNIIVEKEETFKGVYTVLLSSLIYKYMNSKQDVRLHQTIMENGYSGRSFDTKYVTPFLKSKRFRGAMKESGWLTRSLEQNHPYNKMFPGKIRNSKVKSAFLDILDDIEERKVNPLNYITNIIKRSIQEKDKQNVELINPIKKEEHLKIDEIINLLEKHFSYKYNSRGASILPVVAFQSIYECLTKELSRYSDKKVDSLASHYSSDKSSGATGDVVIRDEKGLLFEVVEVKYGIEIDNIILEDAYNKIKTTNTQRYYILSTIEPSLRQKEEFQKRIDEISLEHGVQIIINGLMKTLSYYLRLLSNTNKFIEKYIENIENNPEINYEHKISWNYISQNK